MTSPDSQSASSKHCPPQVVRYLPFDEHQNLAANKKKIRKRSANKTCASQLNPESRRAVLATAHGGQPVPLNVQGKRGIDRSNP